MNLKRLNPLNRFQRWLRSLKNPRQFRNFMEVERLEDRINPADAPLQFFYLPYPEQPMLVWMNSVNPAAGNDIRSVTSITASANNTIIYYDHWEDGFEADLANPVQATTEIWGDNDPSNGIAPGYATDIINAGDIVTLSNNVPANPRVPANIFFDGGDKIGASQTISIARANWPVATAALFADASEVYDTRFYGLSYTAPVGENVATATQVFESTAFFIMASQDNTTIQIDHNADGIVDITQVLNQGEGYSTPTALVLNAGATVVADKPIQVDLVTGDIGSNYESRYFALLPDNLLSNDYFSSVTTVDATRPFHLFVHNTNLFDITVSFETTAGITTQLIAAGATFEYNTLAGSATHVFTTNGDDFAVVGAMDVGGTSGVNQARDWGLSLQATATLSPVAVVAWAPGNDGSSATENGSPIWVTPVENTRIYVDFDGDPATGALIDPLGNRYDEHHDVNRLQIQRIYDSSDVDQTGTRLYTVDGTLISVAYGQDNNASLAVPGIDAGYTVPAFPVPTLIKTVDFAPGGDANGDGLFNSGDTLAYSIQIINRGLYPILNSVAGDALPIEVTYVANSTTVNDGIITISAPDSGVTAFPVDETGLTITNIATGGTTTITFIVTVNAGLASGTTSVVNSADLSFGLVLLRDTNTAPIRAAIGDYVWNDVNADGVQDVGELGFANVTLDLYSDANGDGIINGADAVVQTRTTDAAGRYQFINLDEASYIVVVTDTASVLTGLTQTFGILPHAVNLGAGEVYAVADFGYANVAALPPGLTKTIFATSLPDTGSGQFDAANPDLNVGELVTYRIVATLSEGTYAGGLTLTDALPTDLVPISSQIVSIGSSISGSALGVGATGTLSGQTYTFGLGTGVFNAIDGVSDAGDLIVFEIVARTANVGANVAGHVITNSASLNYGSGIVSASVQADVVAPVLTISKVVDDSTVDALQVVTYTVDITNPAGSTPSTGPAYNLSVTDVPAAGMEIIAGSIQIVSAPGGSNTQIVSNGSNFSVTADLLLQGETIRVTYQARLLGSVAPGASVANSAITTYTSAPTNGRAGTTSTQTPLTVNTSTISGFAYIDIDNNGAFNLGDTPIQNVIISLSGTDHLGNAVTRSATTDVTGLWIIDQLRPSDVTGYSITESNVPAGLLDNAETAGDAGNPFGGAVGAVGTDIISAVVIPLGSNQTQTNYNFGELQPSSIGDFVWEDVNGNGIQDLGELGIANITVSLTGTDDLGQSVTDSVTTGAGGAYAFVNLRPGTYQVAFGNTNGVVTFTRTAQDQGADDTLDSDANPATGATATFALGAGANNTVDAGLYQLTTFGDRVWYDIDGDGVQDAGEPGIVGATVTVTWAGPDGVLGTGDDGTPTDTTTGVDGSWSFAGQPPGTYQVLVSNFPNGLNAPTFDQDGVGTPNLTTFTIGSNQTRDDLDFGYRGSASLGDFVWNDADGDGAQDVGEPGLPGVQLSVTWFGQDDTFGTLDDVVYSNVTTSGAGIYGLANLPAGTFRVDVVNASVPGNLSLTTPVTEPVDVTLTTGQTVLTADFGYVGNASVGDRVWYDVDGDGTQDAGEAGVVGANVVLTWAGNDNTLGTADDVTYSTTTDADGIYTFVGLPVNNAGGDNYRVAITPPAIYATPTFDSDGVGTPNQSDFTLTPAQTRVDQDFGVRGALANGIGDFVWLDANANGQQDGGELGIQGVDVDLFDSTGTVLLNSTTTSVGGAYSFVGLIPGDYQVRFGNTVGAVIYPRSTANLGADVSDSDADATTGFTGPVTVIAGINSTVDAGLFQVASFGDRIWFDTNGDGVQDNGEAGLPGLTVTATWAGADGIFGNGDDVTLAPVTTGVNGAYAFVGVQPGNYRAVVGGLPPSAIPTYDIDGDLVTLPNTGEFSIVSGAVRDDIDFGYQGFGEVGDFVWYDLNRDGIQQASEPGIAGVTVEVVDAGNVVVGSAVTNGAGQYLVQGLPLGTFTVRVVTATLPDQGLTASYDLDGGGDSATAVTLDAVNYQNLNADFGYAGTGVIGDRLWIDYNTNGVQDVGEPGLPNADVSLTWTGPTGPVVLTATTDANGNYLFSNLPGGDYQVQVAGGIPAGIVQSFDPDGTVDASSALTLGNGQTRLDLDFGYRGTSSLAGRVFNDLDNDGVVDLTEVGIAGTQIFLSGADYLGRPVSFVTTTIADGTFVFNNLTDGVFTLTEAQPIGFLDGIDTNGSQPGTQTNDQFTTISLGVGQAATGYLFGEIPPASLSGVVYLDTNRNNQRDIGEAGIAGVTITLQGTDDRGQAVNLSLVTNSNGQYLFSNLRPGNYSVTETQPAMFNGATNLGSQGGATATDVIFASLSAGVNGVANNFGELGANFSGISKNRFLSSTVRTAAPVSAAIPQAAPAAVVEASPPPSGAPQQPAGISITAPPQAPLSLVVEAPAPIVPPPTPARNLFETPAIPAPAQQNVPLPVAEESVFERLFYRWRKSGSVGTPPRPSASVQAFVPLP